MSIDRQNFTVTSVKKSKRRGDENLYTGLPEAFDVWVVHLDSTSFPGRGMDLILESEVKAISFSQGAVLTYAQIGNLMFS